MTRRTTHSTLGLPMTGLPVQSHPDIDAYAQAENSSDDEADETTKIWQCLNTERWDPFDHALG
jgi:hypothetical protein